MARSDTQPADQPAEDVTPQATSPVEGAPKNDGTEQPPEASPDAPPASLEQQPIEGQAAPAEGPTDATVDQAKSDSEWKRENPDEVLVREANNDVAGEGFAYPR